MTRNNRERGAAALEFALSIPILLILCLAGLHLGRAMTARHQLNAAAGYGARAASVAGASAFNPSTIASLVQQQAAHSQCSSPPTVVVQSIGAQPYTRVTVTATCILKVFGSNLIPGIGPTSVSVTASMPLN